MDREKLSANVLTQIKPNMPSVRNTSNLLAQKIRQLIISGEIPEGSYFPNENEFCEQLGIGRGTLREAYKQLEVDGLIERSRRGTHVRNIKENRGNLSLNTAIAVSDYRDLLEFRVMFEAELAYLAAERATDQHIANMEAALASMRENTGNLLLLSYYDMQFHTEVCKAAQNRLLYGIMQTVSDTFEKSIYTAFQDDTDINITQALHYHAIILQAIIDHDGKVAERAMREHVRLVYDRAFAK